MEPETRKDTGPDFSSPFLHFHFGCSRGPRCNQQGYSNDRHVCSVAALCAFVANALLILVGPAFSQAPTEAQRSAIRSECRSDYMAHCSECAAGRHGLAAMPAKEHVEPVVGLPKRGSRRGSAEPKAEAKPESKPKQSPKQNPSKARGEAGIKTRSRAGRGVGHAHRETSRSHPEGHGERAVEKAQQRAGGCDPQRLPLGLHGALRQRTDRRRRRAELSPAEQIKAVGELPAGR